MPIVIQEIEVVPRPFTPAQHRGPHQPAQHPHSSPPNAIGARDVLRVELALRARALRVWAH
jgi:hypothetical protein